MSEIIYHYIIYQTTNLVNSKIYVGKHQTRNLNDGYLGSGKVIKQAIKKYGRENFKRNILFMLNSVEEMNSKESEIVNEEFITRKNTYNLSAGGSGGQFRPFSNPGRQEKHGSKNFNNPEWQVKYSGSWKQLKILNGRKNIIHGVFLKS